MPTLLIGGHSRSVGKTSVVAGLIATLPEFHWTAAKITQYGHGVCAQNGDNCDCAPDEHVCAISWETRADTGTDSSRFLAAGAHRSFWLRTKQGFLAEGLPLLRAALQDTLVANGAAPAPLILESNSLLQFLKPNLYFAVVDPAKDDFKDSARIVLDRADALILRNATDPHPSASPAWTKLPSRLLREKPSVTQREGEPLPAPLHVLVQRALESSSGIAI